MIGKKINQLATELAPVSTDLTIIGDPTTGVSKKITLAQLGAIFSGAVSFYTNLAGFPATGDINVIYCAKDTQKLYLWSGSAYVEVFPSQALLDTYQLRSEKGVSNGYASLDSSGKVPISQLPSSIMEYKGTWNAATNTPTLANGTGDTGDVYICNVAGTVNFGAGPITFAVGDYVIYSGTIWQRSSGAVGTVTSVAVSRSGDALAITGSPITTSGTINIGFAGTGAQYIKGDGTLATFPNTISQAEKLITEVYNSTGATLTKGTIVYINGGQGNLPTVTKALATGDSTSAQTFGVVQADITNNNNGYVVVAGKLSDLDTQAYTPGTQLYLSSTTAGTWTSTKQYAPNHLVYIGIVVRAHPTQGIVEIKIQNGYELDELHNVAAQTPTNNDGLFWESATSLWKNKSIATVLGYTPQAQLSGTGFVKISGTTISYDNSTYLTTSAAASTYLPLVLNGSANTVDINGQQFTIQGSAGGFTSGRIIVDPVFSAIGYQNAGVFDGLKILTNGNAEFTNSGVTRFFNQVRFDSTLTNGTYTYTLPGATGTIALVGGAGVGTVTSVGLSSATSGVTIGSSPITTSGTITLAIATASGSQQGLLSSTDWTTFNNKQNALTNPVTGTGTTNYLPKFTGTSTIGNSTMQDDGTNVSITGGFTANSFLRVFKNGSDSLGSGPFMALYNAGATAAIFQQLNASNGLDWWTTFGKLMTLTASGNLGLGVTPSAWTGTNVKAFQFGNSGALANSGTFGTILFNNSYYNSGYKYITTAATSAYVLDGSTHIWYQAPSGTAGNAISFTQAMTLDASGRLGIGVTNPQERFEIAGLNGNIRLYGRSGISQNTLSNNIYYNGSIWTRDNLSYGAQVLRMDVTNGFFYIDADTTTSGYPATRLTINASTGAATFSSSVTATNVGLGNGFNLTWGGAYGANIPTIIGVSGASGFLTFYPSGSTNGEAARFTNNGNFGIGTTSPVVKLHVDGTGTQYIRVSSSDNATFQQIGAQSGGAFVEYKTLYRFVDTDAGERMRITSGGDMYIGSTSDSYAETNRKVLTLNGVNNALISLRASGTALGYIYAYSSALDFSSVNRDMTFSTGTPNERMRITSGGLVGIGTSSVNDKFVVVGAANIWTGRFDGSSTSSQSYGIVINAGTNSNDSSLLVRNYNGSSTYLNIRGDGQATFSGDVKVKTLEVTNATTYGSSAGISTYMQITVNGNNYVIPLHGTP